MSEPVDAQTKSLARWRAGLAIAAVVLPLSLFLLFERQARRLDALAAQGESVEAHVTSVSNDGRTTSYAFTVDGREYSWSVAREEAPYPPGHAFPATYLPEDPGLSRPTPDRALGAREAERNRRFARKFVLGLAATLAVFAVFAHRDLRRRRSGAPSELVDAQAYKRRLSVTFIALVPAFGLIAGFHLSDAHAKGEPVWPSLIALGLVTALVGGVFFLAGRDGPIMASERSARILKWTVPIALGVALLRGAITLFGE